MAQVHPSPKRLINGEISPQRDENEKTLDPASEDRGAGNVSPLSGPEETEVPVIVDGVVKVLTGLTKRTTCNDIIYALLLQRDEGSGSDEEHDVDAWALVERWRDVERPLQGKTKILKVWRAWGNERNHVTFEIRARTLKQEKSAEGVGPRINGGTTPIGLSFDDMALGEGHYQVPPAARRSVPSCADCAGGVICPKCSDLTRRPGNLYEGWKRQASFNGTSSNRPSRNVSPHPLINRSYLGWDEKIQEQHGKMKLPLEQHVSKPPVNGDLGTGLASFQVTEPRYTSLGTESKIGSPRRFELRSTINDAARSSPAQVALTVAVSSRSGALYSSPQKRESEISSQLSDKNATAQKMALTDTVAKQRVSLDEISERLKETESILDDIETRRHQSRLQENGQNYLQDSYLIGNEEGRGRQVEKGNETVQARMHFHDTLASLSSVPTDQLNLFLQIGDQILILDDQLEESKWRFASVQAVLQGEALETAFEEIGRHEMTEMHKKQESELERRVKIGTETRFMAEEIGLVEKALNDKMAVYNKLQSEIMASDLQSTKISSVSQSAFEAGVAEVLNHSTQRSAGVSFQVIPEAFTDYRGIPHNESDTPQPTFNSTNSQRGKTFAASHPSSTNAILATKQSSHQCSSSAPYNQRVSVFDVSGNVVGSGIYNVSFAETRQGGNPSNMTGKPAHPVIVTSYLDEPLTRRRITQQHKAHQLQQHQQHELHLQYHHSPMVPPLRLINGLEVNIIDSRYSHPGQPPSQTYRSHLTPTTTVTTTTTTTSSTSAGSQGDIGSIPAYMNNQPHPVSSSAHFNYHGSISSQQQEQHQRHLQKYQEQQQYHQNSVISVVPKLDFTSGEGDGTTKPPR